MCETVFKQYAEAEKECIFRWEREIANMHDLVTGAAIGSDALAAEDEVLRELVAARRQIAEAALHRVKGRIGNSDMHFESYFYASVHFGLPEQVEAMKDPHRLNYAEMVTVRPHEIQQEVHATYTPASIREILRKRVFESTAERTQAIREKLVDWLRAHMPVGYSSEEEGMTDQESWLFKRCYNENMKIQDEALNFLLIGMHVLRADGFVCLQGGGQALETEEQADGFMRPPQSSRSSVGACRRRSSGEDDGSRASCCLQ